MNELHTTFLAAIAAETAPEGFAERTFYAEQAQADANKAKALTVPQMHANTLQFEPVMLRSALFRPGFGPRAQFATYTRIPAAGNNVVEFKGEELRQDDQRVLLMLLKAQAGKPIDQQTEAFSMRRFCVDTLGWADSSVSVDKLKASLTRLHDARVRVHYAPQAAKPGRVARPALGLYSFVASAVFAGGTVRVNLDVELAAMFERNVTFLKQSERLALGDGLASWLWAYLQADTCHHEINLEALREVAGKTHCVQKDFNKQIKEAMAELVREKLIAGVRYVNGKETKGRAMVVYKAI